MTSRRKTSALAASALLAALLAPPASALELLVPAYFYPTTHASEWQSLNTVAAHQPLSVVVNPDGGAGTAFDPNYAAAIDALRTAGGKAYGYIGTDWGTRDASAVQAEIDRYLDWYALDGLFVDEVSEYAADLDYYHALRSYVTAAAPALGLIGNPGTPTVEGYLDIFDTLVIYEDSAAKLSSFTAPAYQSQYDASRFGMLVHGADEATMQTLVNGAAAANIGYLYTTDTAFGSRLWQELPSYWDAQTVAAAALTAPVPEPPAALMMLAGTATLLAAARRRARA